MSIKFSKQNLDPEHIHQLKNECFVSGVENDYGPCVSVNAWGETKRSLFLPFTFAKKRFNITLPNNRQFQSVNYSLNERYSFRCDSGRDQEQVFNQALEILEKEQSVLLCLWCGFGKTYTAIRLAHYMGLKTAVLAHRTILFDQWTDAIKQFTNAKVQQVDTNGVIDPNADFYIFNTGFVFKKWNSETKSWTYKNLGIFKFIGLLIVDEAHIACASEMSKALLYFEPRMTIALTATPYRKDGLDKVLDLYFGSKITRISASPFIVYKVNTDIKPVFSYNAMGKKDWNSVISFLVLSPERNKIIADIVAKHIEYKILILTKRKNHCDLLAELLTNSETVTVMKGSDRDYNKEARVLISTFSKLGVGFDDTSLNMFIMACDTVEIEQYAGRLRYNGNTRLIFDLGG